MGRYQAIGQETLLMLPDEPAAADPRTHVEQDGDGKAAGTGDGDPLAWVRARVAALGAMPDVVSAGGPADAGGRAAACNIPLVTTGVAAIDRHLPWGGLPRNGLHEVAGTGATHLVLTLMMRLLADPAEARPVFWCMPERMMQERGMPYLPALTGLDPGRLMLVETRREREALWAMEEALVSGAAAMVIGDIVSLGMTESRRLQLAAARGGCMAVALRGAESDRGASAALSRWRVESVSAPVEPSGTARRPLPGLPAVPRFDLSLWRCRGGRPQAWTVTHDPETFHLDLADRMDHRPAAPGRPTGKALGRQQAISGQGISGQGLGRAGDRHWLEHAA